MGQRLSAARVAELAELLDDAPGDPASSTTYRRRPPNGEDDAVAR
jgi:hypothetical protein